jgi:hypothetical protein
VIIIIVGAVIIVFVLFFNRQVLSSTLIASLSALLGAIVAAIVSLGSATYQLKKTSEQERLLREQLEQSEIQVLALSLTQQLSPRRNEEEPTLLQQEQETLRLLQQRLELDKQLLDLQQEQQTVEWQREALTLTTISPRSAMMIAWLGIEQELQRLVNQHSLFAQVTADRVRTPYQIINMLRDEDYITAETFNTMKDMQNTRNKIAHGFNEGEISAEDAMRFVQQTILLEKTLSAKQTFNKATTE